MSRTICPTCGAAFEGWHCPTCYVSDRARQTAKEVGERSIQAQHEVAARLAERIAEEQELSRQAQYEAAYRMEQASAEASRQHRETISNSWRLEAKAKADRAHELYRAGLFEEAAALAQQAIQQDPSNLDAYKAAAWSLEAQGNQAEARRLFAKQLALLPASEQNESPIEFGIVLTGLPPDDELLTTARQLLGVLIPSWRLQGDISYVLKAMIYRGWRAEVGRLVDRLREKPDPAVLVPHIMALREAGYSAEGTRLAMNTAAAYPSLWHYRWAIEMAGDSSTQEVAGLSKWLAIVPAARRHELRQEFIEMKVHPQYPLSGRALGLIRDAMVQQRMIWQGEIATELSNNATRNSCAQESHRTYWRSKAIYPLTPIPIGVSLALLFGFLIPAALERGSPWLRSSVEHAQPFLVFLSAISLVAPIYFLRRKARTDIYRTSYCADWDAENYGWQTALGYDSSSSSDAGNAAQRSWSGSTHAALWTTALVALFVGVILFSIFLHEPRLEVAATAVETPPEQLQSAGTPLTPDMATQTSDSQTTALDENGTAPDLTLSPSQITANSVGPVQLGMTVAQARQALPTFSFGRSTDGEGMALIEVRSAGVVEMVLYAGEGDSQSPINDLASLQAIFVYGSEYATPEGVHPGMPLSDVESRFGKLTEITLSEIESREYADFANKPPGLTIQVGLPEVGLAGNYSEGERRTSAYFPTAVVTNIMISE